MGCFEKRQMLWKGMTCMVMGEVGPQLEELHWEEPIGLGGSRVPVLPDGGGRQCTCGHAGGQWRLLGQLGG